MKKIWIGWTVSLLLCLTALTVNFCCFRVKDMIRIELASNADTMRHYIELTDPASAKHSYHQLLMNTKFDYLFIIGYTLLTLFSFKILLGVFQASTGAWVYLISIMTGLFDCIENIFLMNSGIRQREDFSWLFYDLVRIKWAFAIVNVMVITIVLIYSFIFLFRLRKEMAMAERISL